MLMSLLGDKKEMEKKQKNFYKAASSQTDLLLVRRWGKPWKIWMQALKLSEQNYKLWVQKYWTSISDTTEAAHEKTT